MSNARDGRGGGCQTLRFTGGVMQAKKCPVCDWEIKDGGIKVKVAGKEITVCCDECAKKAKKSPKKYAGAAK
jgi:ribosome-binding protein aMBF1 (putative translation factor)